MAVVARRGTASLTLGAGGARRAGRARAAVGGGGAGHGERGAPPPPSALADTIIFYYKLFADNYAGMNKDFELHSKLESKRLIAKSDVDLILDFNVSPFFSRSTHSPVRRACPSRCHYQSSSPAHSKSPPLGPVTFTAYYPFSSSKFIEIRSRLVTKLFEHRVSIVEFKVYVECTRPSGVDPNDYSDLPMQLEAEIETARRIRRAINRCVCDMRQRCRHQTFTVLD
ncbi:hypothetical protein EVAR_36361_1 [Eumeta japonica]|uniref:Uncharacterized protein n=1 Tax=Eumeta variegata TaxID=151549 RepID=A0A4C1W5N4_EUMVA|nr:hypothetical protein EVAR_36361_1 [Eumeta japonica]